MSQKNGYRYPGARPFGDCALDRKLFFGRDDEIEYLFHSILVENLFVLFAKSGMGKTSLLNAGVMEPLRREGFIPLTIRLNDRETSPLESLYRGIDDALEQRNNTVNAEDRIDYERGETDTLWQFFKTAAFWSSGDKQLIPVIILDQFEEFFTMHSPEHRRAFITQLSDLVRGGVPANLRNAFRSKPLPYSKTPPKVKIVISMREDYLGHLDELSYMIPRILRSRYRLMPLACEQARDAIIKPAQLSRDDNVRAQGFSYADETVDEMLGFLSERIERNKTVKTDEVEPFQLQLLCRHIEEKVEKKAAKKTGGYEVQTGDLGGKDGMKKVLQGFYENRIRGLGSVWERARARKLCEKGLIDNNLRLSLEQGYIKRKFKVPGELLSLLVDSRLLRSEPRVGSLYYELSHDTLVQPILESQRERKIRRNWVTVPILLLVLIFIALFAASRISKNIHLQELYKEAMEYKKKGMYSAAVEYYKQILELDGKHAAPYLELGELRELQNYGTGAIAVYQKAIDKGIKNEVIHYRLGHLYALDKRLEKAAAYYEKAIDINPERAVYHVELGDIYSRRNNFAEAEKSYKDALALDEKNVSAYKGLLVLYIKHDSLEDALNIYKKTLRGHFDFAYTIVRDIALVFKKEGQFGDLERLYYITSVPHFFSRNSALQKKFGDLYAGLNEYKQAINNYKGALYPGCKDASIYKGLAVAHVNVGEPGKAIDVYAKAIKADPANVRIFGDIAIEMKNRGMMRELKMFYQIASAGDFHQAVQYEKLGTAFYYLREYDRAMENYQKALALDNTSISAYKGLAVVHVYRGNPRAALDVYRKAAAVNVDSADIYRDIAWAMNKNKTAGGWEELLHIAFEVDSKKVSFYDKLGRDFYKLKIYDRAIDAYKKALNLDDKHASVYTGLAAAYIKNGNPAAALDVYRKAVKTNVDFADIYKDIDVAFGKEMPEEREKLLKIALEVNSDEASYFEKLGSYLKKKKMYDAAGESFKKALNLDDKNATTYAELGVLYIEKGNPEKALDLFRKAVNNVHFELAKVLVKISAAMSKKKMSAQRKKLLEIAAGADSREASFYDTLGFYYLHDRDSAIEFYKKSLELDDGNADYYNNLSILYIENGQAGKAIDVFRRAVETRVDYAYCYKIISAKLKEKKLTAELDIVTRLYQEAKKRE